jgi:Trk-type K+ transport system membrane component
MLLSLLGAVVIFYLEGQKFSFVGCLFTTVSAVCVAGLMGVNYTIFSDASLIVLCVLMTLGGTVIMSVVPIVIRKFYFRKGYFAQNPVCSRKAHRLEAEYQALTIVKRTTLALWVFPQAMSVVALGVYFTEFSSQQVLFHEREVNPWFFAIFHTISAFTNAGLGLFIDNLVPFQSNPFVLLISCTLILWGNVAFPIILRFSIWMLHRLFPSNPGLKYLLKNPRRCCTHLFPSLHTRVLALSVVGFSLFEFVAFVALDFNEPFLKDIPKADRILIGFFQAVSTRTAGFNVINLADVAPGMLVMYCVLMYISSYPIVSALRESSEKRVYESPEDESSSSSDDERHAPKEEHNEHIPAPQTIEPAGKKVSPKSVLKHIKFASSGVIFMMLSLFIICSVDEHVARVDVFYILFELASAYGTVGLSVIGTSLDLGTISKLVVMIVMIAGRQRGLPRSIDRAVFLPHLFNVDSRIARRNSFIRRIQNRKNPRTERVLLEVASKLKRQHKIHTLRRAHTIPMLAEQLEYSYLEMWNDNENRKANSRHPSHNELFDDERWQNGLHALERDREEKHGSNRRLSQPTHHRLNHLVLPTVDSAGRSRRVNSDESRHVDPNYSITQRSRGSRIQRVETVQNVYELKKNQHSAVKRHMTIEELKSLGDRSTETESENMSIPSFSTLPSVGSGQMLRTSFGAQQQNGAASPRPPKSPLPLPRSPLPPLTSFHARGNSLPTSSQSPPPIPSSPGVAALDLASLGYFTRRRPKSDIPQFDLAKDVP